MGGPDHRGETYRRLRILKYTERRDANEVQIVSVLEKCGVTVERLHPKSGGGVPDLLCGYRKRNKLLEVKVPGGTLQDSQVKWHKTWRGEVSVVHDAQEALSAMGIRPRLDKITAITGETTCFAHRDMR